jgi:hypothetical protein
MKTTFRNQNGCLQTDSKRSLTPLQLMPRERYGLWAVFMLTFVETVVRMTTLELKNNFHQLIDSIENENLLLKFYDLMRNRSIAKEGNLWSRLSKEEQHDLLSAFNESENEENLINQNEMMKKHKKWL